MGAGGVVSVSRNAGSLRDAGREVSVSYGLLELALVTEERDTGRILMSFRLALFLPVMLWFCDVIYPSAD